ncbi:MAG TPA: glycosyltransferase family 4 protein [Pyrinomonadaceae bacterium]|nr:glycosyltransferase family 4 protein [Pyrinomonadaceae bacterium]
MDTFQTEAIRASTLDRSALRRRFSIPENKFVVLAVGQFIDRKGRWIFLEAIEKISKLRDDIIFVWLMPSLPSANDNLRIKGYDNIGDRFLPVLSSDIGLSRSDVLFFFLVADVFALPSYIEGLPIALLEAMSLQIPSISTNVYAIPEAIRHEETGLLIEPGNADQLAEAVLRLRTHRELRNLIGVAGSEIVRSTFDESDSAKVAFQAYDNCFNANRQ